MIDLWPPELKVAPVKSPVAILREQAALLKSKTDGEIEADVELGESKTQGFIYHFYLIAPTLNNYRFRLFSVVHDVSLYPVRIYVGEDLGEELNATLDKEDQSNKIAQILSNSGFAKIDLRYTLVASTEADFIELLSRILQSRKTREVIGALRAQVDNRYRGLEDVF